MIPNAVSLSSLPPTMNSLGSLASLGSLSLGLVCAATTASGTAIPFEPISRSVILDPVPHDEDRTRNTYNGLHAREPQAGERTDAVPSRGGPKKGDGRVDGSLPNGPERKVGDDTPGTKSPGMVITECSVPGTAALTFVSSFRKTWPLLLMKFPIG